LFIKINYILDQNLSPYLLIKHCATNILYVFNELQSCAVHLFLIGHVSPRETSEQFCYWFPLRKKKKIRCTC